MTRILIIGTGFAGYELARQIRQHDEAAKITLITQDDGTNYNKPTLSKALSFQMTPELLASDTAEQMSEKLKATIFTQAKVTEINTQEQYITCAQEHLVYDKLVLALGANTNKLNFSHTYHVNTLTDYRQFYNAIQHKKRIAIIGTGLVGCEFACDLSNTGYDVSMVSIDNALMSKILPEKISEILKSKMVEKGVKLHLNTEIKSIIKNCELSIELNNNTQINCDVILSAIGLTPNIELAKAADIKTNRGIVTNEYLQTSDENIYALGDCAEIEGMVFQHIAPIRHAASILAKTLTGEKTKLVYPPLMYGVKTSYYPLRVCRAPNIDNKNWEVEVDDKQNAKALHYNQDKQCDAFIFCGEHLMDREGQQTLVKTMRNWLG